MPTDPDLYDAILARRSTRRYAPAPLDAAAMGQVQEIVSGAVPLVPANHFGTITRTTSPAENLVTYLGAYGRLLSPPHYLVPYLVGQDHPLTDLGYRVQQLAVRLTGLGIGPCFVGSLGREQDVVARFKLPAKARIGAFLIFGWPATSLGGRAVNSIIRIASGATNKLSAEQIFLDGSFANAVAPPSDLAPLVEAARNAPSAVDAQPWRLLWQGGRLYLFVKRQNLRYGGGPRGEYRLHDGGTCMANVSLALEALGRAGRWRLFAGTEPEIPDYPADLQPLAVLAID